MTVQGGKPILAFYGHHKAGTSWITKILEDYCQQTAMKMVISHAERSFECDVPGFLETNPCDLWLYTNADYLYIRDLGIRGFHVIRDPRDMVVSGYFSHLYSHSDEFWPRLRVYRPYLRSLPKEEGLMKEMEFSAPFIYHMMSWDYDTPNILQLRFEDLIADPVAQFVKVFRFLHLLPGPADETALIEMVHSHSFEKYSGGRKVGQEDPRNHFRRGIPGDWKNHFSEAHKDHFKKLFNPILLQLKYETTEDW